MAKTAVDSRNEHGDNMVLTLNARLQSVAVAMMKRLLHGLRWCVALALQLLRICEATTR